MQPVSFLAVVCPVRRGVLLRDDHASAQATYRHKKMPGESQASRKA
jgi:hypothetical protein